MTWLFWLWSIGLPPIPESMTFCGMHTRILPEARSAIQHHIIKLHEHPPTLEALVARAESLMPYIEEALAYIGVPEDLKFIAIQESRLNPHAVSRSQAVGYWQLKDFTAREVGLVINDTIDERKHLFRSSAAAALYFAKQYMRHRNWLFAIIAYYEGGTGALPYIDTAYIGKDEICITAKTHWYAIRAIAYKLTFEPLLRKRLYGLRPVAYEGPPVPALTLAQEHGLTLEAFMALNPWLRRPILPGGRPSTYYVPLEEPLAILPQEPLKGLFQPAPFPAAYASVPTAYQYAPKDTTEMASKGDYAPLPMSRPIKLAPAAAYLPLEKEPYLQSEWAYPAPPMNRRLTRWNPFYRGDGPVLIIPPRRAHVHIVQAAETPADIARHYRRPLAKVLAYNHLTRPDTTLPRGMRILLREERPYDEKPVIYQW